MKIKETRYKTVASRLVGTLFLKENNPLWRNIARIAGAFSFVICILIIVNYIQINRIDPVENKTLDALVSRLNQTPGDQQLREQIRTLDLLARKAYFTSQWQIRMGGYLLLVGIIVLIIAMQMLAGSGKKNVEIKAESKTDLILLQKQSRRWLIGFSIVLVGITLVFAFLTYRQLDDKFDQTLAQISTPPPPNEEQVEKSSSISSKTIPVDKNQTNEPSPINPFENKLPNKENMEENEKAAGKAELNKNTVVENQTETKTARDIAKAESEKAKDATTSPENNFYTSAIPGFEYSVPYPEKVALNFASFRGPGGNGVAFQKNIPLSWDGETGENILWKTEIPLQGYNSPVIWDDMIFLSGASKSSMEVYCIDRHNGKIFWTSLVENIPGSPATAPKVPDYTGYAASTGACDGTHFYAIFANADVAAFNFEGKQVWGRNLGVPDNHYGYSSSLLVYQGQLIIQWDQRNVAKVMALSTKTGETLWENNREVKISWASPVIAYADQEPQLILAADPYLAAYNPLTGVELWKIKCLSGEVGPSPVIGGNLVFALNEYASLVAIKPGAEPKKVWEDYSYLSDVPSPVATDKHLIVATSYGLVACFAIGSGEMLWEAEFDNSVYASPMIAEGRVFLLDKQGIMHIFEAGASYQHIADCPLGEGSVCTPAFADGHIYIRGEKHLFGIGK